MNDTPFQLDMHNKRQFGRVSVYIEGAYQYKGRPSDCVILNLSVSGAAVKVPQFFSENDTITLTFDLPTSGKIAIEGNVRYMRGTTIGVQFIDTKPDVTEKLAAFIDGESRRMLYYINGRPASSHDR